MSGIRETLEIASDVLHDARVHRLCLWGKRCCYKEILKSEDGVGVMRGRYERMCRKVRRKNGKREEVGVEEYRCGNWWVHIQLRLGRALLGAIAVRCRAVHGILLSEEESKGTLYFHGDRRKEAVAVVGEITTGIMTSVERKITPIEVASFQII